MTAGSWKLQSCDGNSSSPTEMKRITRLVIILCLVTQLSAQDNPLLPSKTNNTDSLLSGKHLIVAGEIWQPWFNIEEHENGTLAYSGIMWEVLNYLATSLNFTYTMVRPPDGKWGIGDAEVVFTNYNDKKTIL